MNRKATLIIGGQGSGKAEHARQLAKAFKKPMTVDGDFVRDRFPFASVPGDVDVLIVEDVDFASLRGDMRTRLKSWITSPTIRVERKHQEPIERAGLNFIFTTGDADALHLGADDRRFHVVRLPA